MGRSHCCCCFKDNKCTLVSLFFCLQNSKIRANFGSRPFAYAEGQAHRNAADLCVDLAEEISANFEALPFAMASDSDNDAGASVTSDSGSHGPPCRIAAVAVPQQRTYITFISTISSSKALFFFLSWIFFANIP